MTQAAARSESLALEGGAALRTRPFAPWPVFAEDERKASDAVLASGRVNYWTGEECKRFEAEFAARVGVAHAISLANGTLALELALRVLGVGPGDEVVVPAKTFLATASCAVAVGAKPVICDVDPESQLMTAASLRPVLSSRTRAIIPVHLAGWPCAMGPIMDLAREKKLFVVEDAAQAHGAKWNGKAAGSFGDLSVFSFCQDKIMTTGGEGGMLLSNRRDLWQRAWEYKDHGKSWDLVQQSERGPAFKWVHESFGSNYRMTEMQAAIGRVQLGKLDDWVAARRRNAAALAAGLKGVPGIRVPQPGADCFHSYYKLYAVLEPARLKAGWSLLRVIEAIAAEGVPCQQGTCSEIYREKAFGGTVSPLPAAARLSETSLMFLVHPTLQEADMADTARAVAKVMRSAARA